jgi:hypothetical protein
MRTVVVVKNAGPVLLGIGRRSNPVPILGGLERTGLEVVPGARRSLM